jgi:hypothetical protein
MPEGLLPVAASADPMSVSELRNEMQNLQKTYEADPQSNKAMLDLKKIYDAHLDSELNKIGLGDTKNALDAKFKKLSDVKSMLGIDKGMTGIEPQEVARDIAKKFESAARSDPNSLNDVAQAGAHLISLDPEMAPILSGIADDAENLSVSKSVNKESPISQGLEKAHLSGHAITSNIGLLGGRAQGAVQDSNAFKFIQQLIKGTTNLANTEPEQVASVASHMLSSENPTTKRMGSLLGKVSQEADPARRRALMFSLSQQPYFRQAIGNLFSNTPTDGFDQEK